MSSDKQVPFLFCADSGDTVVMDVAESDDEEEEPERPADDLEEKAVDVISKAKMVARASAGIMGSDPYLNVKEAVAQRMRKKFILGSENFKYNTCLGIAVKANEGKDLLEFDVIRSRIMFVHTSAQKPEGMEQFGSLTLGGTEIFFHCKPGSDLTLRYAAPGS